MMLAAGFAHGPRINARIVQSGSPSAMTTASQNRCSAGRLSTSNRLPYPNIAPAGAQSFVEPGVINYNRDLPAGASLGRLQPTCISGYPLRLGASYENWRWRRSPSSPCAPDSPPRSEQRRTASASRGLVRDGPDNVLTLANSTGGRGSADTTFDFHREAGWTLPVPLIWEQGQGGPTSSGGPSIWITPGPRSPSTTTAASSLHSPAATGPSVSTGWHQRCPQLDPGSDPRFASPFSSDLAVGRMIPARRRSWPGVTS
jgi:hypothetical protein